jgi:hypothetical protein
VSLLLFERHFEDSPPGADVGVLAQQCATLTFSHAAPDAELDPVVECIGETFEPDRTASADFLGVVLFSPLYEQRVRIALLTERPGRPVDQQSHLHDLPVRFFPFIPPDSRVRVASRLLNVAVKIGPYTSCNRLTTLRGENRTVGVRVPPKGDVSTKTLCDNDCDTKTSRQYVSRVQELGTRDRVLPDTTTDVLI